MDSNMAAFLESVYHHVNKDSDFIDLGLSLKTLHPEAACNDIQDTNHSLDLGSTVVPGEYNDLIQWPYLNPLNLKGFLPKYSGCSTKNQEESGENLEGFESRDGSPYVKVNMDGVIVGRKICILHVAGYSALALQLEDMFGRLSQSGLHLFQVGSEFILFYKDAKDNWRPVGDVPWKDFADSVKRLRIVRKSNLILS